MKLSAENAKVFWPIYREYESALGEQAITRAEFIAEFIEAHRDGTFDNPRAKDMAKRWFKAQRARVDLLEKYHSKIEKNLSSVQAGQFLQIEKSARHLHYDMTIAAEMPGRREAQVRAVALVGDEEWLATPWDGEPMKSGDCCCLKPFASPETRLETPPFAVGLKPLSAPTK